MDLSEKLECKLKEAGATIVGFSNVTGAVNENLRTIGHAITVGVRLSDFIIDEIKKCPTYTYFHHYRTVNFLIDQITLKGTMLLQERGFRALAVPASQTVNNVAEKHCGIFPHKTAAVAARLGWIGKSGLFISTAYGPRIRLGTILTDAPLECKEHTREGDCGECNRCVESCPAMALTGKQWEVGCSRSQLVDANACSDYMNANYKHIGRGSVCGICISVCPKGACRRKVEKTL